MPRYFDKEAQHAERHAVILPTDKEFEQLKEDPTSLDMMMIKRDDGLYAPRDDTSFSSQFPNRPQPGVKEDWEIKLGLTNGNFEDINEAAAYKDYIAQIATNFATQEDIPFPIQAIVGTGTWENDRETSVRLELYDVDVRTVEAFLNFLGEALPEEEAFAFKPQTAPSHALFENPSHDPDDPNPGGSPA